MIEDMRAKSTEKTRDRIRGCLLGVAIGDALGAPFEHLGPGQSNKALDRTGGRIVDFHPWRYGAGSWTDDTGLTLATCRALIRMARTAESAEICFKEAFHAWAGSDECRVPGKTVLFAAKYGVPDVDSWANGALMRNSPIGLYAQVRRLGLDETATLSFVAANLTHGHPLATFPAVEMALAVRSILADEKRVPEALSDPGGFCKGLDRYKYARYEKYREVRHKPIDAVPPSTGLWMWRHVLERCLALEEGALWSSMPSFETGILKVVNESYDRDTAGAVAGALLGSYWGESGIPERWRSRVQKRKRIVHLADELLSLAEMPKSEIANVN